MTVRARAARNVRTSQRTPSQPSGPAMRRSIRSCTPHKNTTSTSTAKQTVVRRRRRHQSRAAVKQQRNDNDARTSTLTRVVGARPSPVSAPARPLDMGIVHITGANERRACSHCSRTGTNIAGAQCTNRFRYGFAVVVVDERSLAQRPRSVRVVFAVAVSAQSTRTRRTHTRTRRLA